MLKFQKQNHVTKKFKYSKHLRFSLSGKYFFVYKVVLTRFRSNAVTIFTTVMKWCKIFPNVWFIKRTSYQDILMQKFTLFRVKLHFDRLAGIHVKIYLFVSFIELLLLCIKRVFFFFLSKWNRVLKNNSLYFCALMGLGLTF